MSDQQETTRNATANYRQHPNPSAVTPSRLAVIAGGVVLVIFAIGLVGCAGRSGASASPTVSAATEPPVPTPYPHTVIPVEGNPLVAAGSVWVTGRTSVTRIDPVTDEVLATVEVDGWPHGLAADGSDLWATVGECATLDPGSCDDGVLVRIDADRNEVVETIPVGTWGYAIAIHEDTLWMSSFEDGLVVRVDRSEGRVVAEIPVTDPTGIAAAEDGVWTPLHYTGLVARIDPETNEVTMLDTETVATEFVALTDDAVWVTTGDRSLEIVVLSRETGEVVERIPAAWPQGIHVHDGTVWVALSGTDDHREEDSGIIAIDAETREIVAEYPLPYTGVSDLATDGETLWVPGPEGLLKLDVGD